VVADVRDLAAMQAAAGQAVDKFGGIDVVVANAGIASYGSVLKVDPEAVKRVLDVNLLGVFHTSVWSMPVAAWCAQAEGARGDGEAAAAALHSSEQAYGPQVAVFLPDLELARAWERTSVGQTMAARMHAMCAAQIARQSGMDAVEMRALHTAVRFGDRSCAARLHELARTLNTPLAEAIATQAGGLANHDGDLLDVAAARFADLDALALAADAAAQAAGEHARTGHRGKEVESSTRAYRLAGQCGLHTPAVEAAAHPLPISGREREIAMLVAAGLPNRQIADRLFVMAVSRFAK
jgi:ATP/maltotriose-dependent transcriptional regulator MalT